MSKKFLRAATKVGLKNMGLVLYSLRHGGASDDTLRKARPLNEVKKRGRWRADSSVRRYEKKGSVQAVLALLIQMAVNFCDASMELLLQIFINVFI